MTSLRGGLSVGSVPRVRADATVHVMSSGESNTVEDLLDRGVYAVLHRSVPHGFSVRNLLDFMATRTQCPVRRFEYQLDGDRCYIIIFPHRSRRRTFLTGNRFVTIDTCRVQFEPWDASDGAEHCRYVTMA